MTYETIESGVESASPIYLYQFAQGASVWRYTNDIADVAHAAATWETSPISHSGVNQTGDVARDAVTLTFPVTHEFGRQFIGVPPDNVTTVTIFRGHRGSDDYLVWWKGRVSTSKVNGETLEIECESVFTSLKRSGLGPKSQGPCRHTVYFGRCGLNKADFSTSATVTAVSGANVTVSVTGDPGPMVGGMLETADGRTRMVLSYASGSMVLARKIPGLTVGAAVILYQGCDRTKTRCASFPNAANTSGTNIENHGGYSFKPSKNPFAGTIS